MTGRHWRVEVLQLDRQLAKQDGFDSRAAVEMNDGGGVPDAIEHASTAVDDDVGMAGQSITIGLLALERVRPDQDSPVRARVGELADGLQIIRENLFQIGEKAVDIVGVQPARTM